MPPSIDFSRPLDKRDRDLDALPLEELQARLERQREDNANISMIVDGIGLKLASEDELMTALSTRKGPQGEMVNRRGVLSDYPIDETRVSRDLVSLRDSIVNRGVASVSGMDASATKAYLNSTWAGIVRAASGLEAFTIGTAMTPYDLATQGTLGGAGIPGVPLFPGTNALGLTNTQGDEMLDPEARHARLSQARANVTSLLTGITNDPTSQEIYLSSFPRAATFFGDLTSMILMLRGGAPLGRAAEGLEAAGAVEGAAVANKFGPEALRRLAGLSGTSNKGLAATLALGGAGALTGFLTASEDDRGLEAARWGITTMGGAYFLMSILTGRPYGVVGRTVLAGEQATKLGGIRQLGMALRESPRMTVGYMAGAGVQGTALGTMAASSEGKSPTEAIMAGLEEGLMWIGTDVVASRIGSTTRWSALVDSSIAKRAQEWGAQLGLMPNKQQALAAVVRTMSPASAALGAAAGAGAAQVAGGDPATGAEVGSALAITRSFALRRLGTTLPSATFRDLLQKGINGLTGEQAGQVAAGITRNITDDVALHDIANDAEAEVFKRAAGTNGPTLNEWNVVRRIAKLEQQLAQVLPLEQDITQASDEQIRSALDVGGKLMAMREKHAQLLRERDEVFVARGVFETPDGQRSAWVRDLVDRATIEQQIRDAFDNRRFATDVVDANVGAMDEELRAVAARRASGEQALADQSAAMDAASTAERNLDAADRFKQRHGDLVNEARADIGETMTPDEVWRELGRARGQRAETVKRVFGRDLDAAIDELAGRRAGAGNATEPLRGRAHMPTGSTESVGKVVDAYFNQRGTLDALGRLPDETLTEDAARQAIEGIGGKLSSSGPTFTIKLPFVGEVSSTWLRDAIAQARTRMKDVLPAIAIPPGFTALNGNDEDGNPVAAWTPTAAAAASLLALGMVIHPWKGNLRMPMRINSIIRTGLELIRRGGQYKEREVLIGLLEDGKVFITRGAKAEGRSGQASVRVPKGVGHRTGEVSMVLSLHNHPPGVIANRAQHLDNHFPSLGDIQAIAHMAPSNATHGTGYILTPDSTITRFTVRKQYVAAVPTIAHDLLTADDFYQLARTGTDPGDPRNGAALYDYALYGKFGGNEDAFMAAMDALYARYGIDVERAISPQDVERAFADQIRAARPYVVEPPHVDPTVLPTVERFTDPPQAAQLRTNLAKPVDANWDALNNSLLDRLIEGGTSRVSPAGANRVARILPMSVTPQAITQAPYTLEAARVWASQHGLNLAVETLDGRRTFVLRLAGNSSSALASDITLKGALAKLAVEARKAQAGTASGESGSAKIGLLIGAALGAPVGAALQQWMRNPSDPDALDPNYAGAGIGAALGAVAMAFVGAAASGMHANLVGRKTIQLFAPPVGHQMPLHDAVTMVGKTGVTKAEFLSMPVAQQVAHRKDRLAAAARLDLAIPKDRIQALIKSFPKGMSADDRAAAMAVERQAQRRARVLATARKFTPTHIPPELWNDFETSTLGAAKAAGMTDGEAALMLRGNVVHMLTSYPVRVNPSHVDLMSLGNEARNALGTASSTEELRRLITTATVMAGPDMPIPDLVREATHANLRNQLTPDAQEWKELIAAADKANIDLTGIDPVTLAGNGWLFGSIRPPEGYRTIGEQLERKGDASGSKILRLFNALMGGTQSIRRDLNEHLEGLGKIFEGVSHGDKQQVHKIMQDPALKARIEVENPALFKAVAGYREWLNTLAQQVGLDPNMSIEHYFPWIYSTRTIEKLKREGRIPTDIMIPIGSGIAEYKILKHLQARWGKQPLGEILTDPVEVGTLYAYGAIRKYHLDPIMTQFNGAWFKDLAKAEPFIAADMGRWMLDVFGMPSKTYVQAAAAFHSWGVGIEKLGSYFNLSNQGMFQEMLDRYFIGQGAVDRFTRAARGLTYYSKVGGNLISALVNTAQLVTNSGTDMGFGSIFIGGGGFTASTGISAALEAVEKALPEGKLSNFIHPYASGNAKLRFAREVGVYSDTTKSMMEDVASQILREAGPSFALSAAGVAIGAGVGLAAVDPDSQTGRTIGASGAAATGAGIGISMALIGPALFRRMLSAPLHVATAPFQIAEALNRGMTAGAARREFARGAALKAGTLSRGAARTSDFIENTMVGGASGALVGGTFGASPDAEGFDPDAAMTGAMFGGLMGAGIGMGKPRAEIAADRLRWIDRNAAFIPDFRKRLQDMGGISLEDAEKWYTRQALDMAQFRFGREARPQWLRTPVGEVAGALQSFTLNQAEFFGSRLQSFYRSLELVGEPGATGLLRATAKGQVDMRIWKHMMLLGGSAGALTAMTAGLFDYEGSPWYWLSRIGLGFMPIISYNQDAGTFQFNSIGEHLTGPFIKDVQAAGTFMLHMYDPIARMNYEMELDTLARRLFPAFHQLEAAPETLGTALEKARQDGLQDLVMQQQQRAQELAYPGSAVRNRVNQFQH